MSTPNPSEPIPTAVLVARRARPASKRKGKDWFPWQLPWVRIAIGGSIAFQALLLAGGIYFVGMGGGQPLAEGDLLDAPVPKRKVINEPLLVAKVAPQVDQIAEHVPAEEPFDLLLVRKDQVVECARIGTDVRFMKDPAEAFQRAREEKKMVFMVHLSGNLEDKEFT